MPERTPGLADRLAELDISTAELAAMVRRPLALVEAWVEDGPDAEAKVLLRVLDNDHAATLAAERVRHRGTLPLRGGTGTAAGVEPPYGSGHQGTTGGQPK